MLLNLCIIHYECVFLAGFFTYFACSRLSGHFFNWWGCFSFRVDNIWTHFSALSAWHFAYQKCFAFAVLVSLLHSLFLLYQGWTRHHTARSQSVITLIRGRSLFGINFEGWLVVYWLGVAMMTGSTSLVFAFTGQRFFSTLPGCLRISESVAAVN